ncbi:hypothetical protein M199_gp122 [Halogranum tailed virus 1]|uniref:Uncharacterized protein n=1 Tax=Halogranum tailed virus 1 TaxID=1273749 RepID=R4T736_9CAUD|nr:hypothetical protein M199_gp122 [Halogranum tailed virus 1]AGM11544.1 hypothetical protein HGTV1_247 [Halogranum tailed virus 1]
MITHAYNILRSWVTTSRRTEIHGVTVTYSGTRETYWNEWQDVLNEWLPRFEEAGWLRKLNAIHIDRARFMGDGTGEYQWLFKTICLDPNPRMSRGYNMSTKREHILIHEMAHHAHNLEVGAFPSHKSEVVFNRHKRMFEQHVSEYAGTDFYEAVAETATGSVIGHEYPDELMNAYWKLGGPKELSALREK